MIVPTLTSPTILTRIEQVRFPSKHYLPRTFHAYEDAVDFVQEIKFVPEEERTSEQPHKYGLRILCTKTPVPNTALVGEWVWFHYRSELYGAQQKARTTMSERARALVKQGDSWLAELIHLDNLTI